jgi:PAT family beta-lactamase induction signal transducer AmpG
MGLGRALWIFGLLQSFAHLGYAVVAAHPNLTTLYCAQAFEMGTNGLATGAFSVLLYRLTQKRFSATQYALLTSLMSISRVVTGPPAGLLVDAIGWRDFFILTVFTGIPGMLLLQRFVPWSVKDPVFKVAEPSSRAPLTAIGLAWRGGAIGLASAAFGGLTMAALAGAKAARKGEAFALAERLQLILYPSSTGDWLTSVSILFFALLVGVSVAAALAARRGIASRPLQA